MTRNYFCWKCDHFLPDNVLTALSGRCTRKAPHALSQNGFGAAPAEIWYNAGIVNPILIGGPGLMTVISRSGDITQKHLVWFEDTEGLNDNDSYPWVIPAGYQLTKLCVALSRANTGAATVGIRPVLNLNIATVGGTAITTLARVPVPLDPLHCGILDAAADNYQFVEYDLTPPLSIPAGLWGIRIDLVDGLDENVIVQVRNPQIGALVRYNHNLALTANSSLAKYAAIPDGTTNRCGKFKPATGTVPAVPVIPEV